MFKKVLIAGLLGGIVLMAWTFLVNAVFGLNARINMKQIAAEREVYEVLKKQIVTPGRYIFNPELTSEGRFPDGEPVFSILYGGVGHEFAGKFMVVGFILFFLAPIVAAWMLSQASVRVLSSYPRKVMFFVKIGLLIALFRDLTDFGIGSYPARDAIILAVHHIIVWTLVGLVVAWRLKHERTDMA